MSRKESWPPVPHVHKASGRERVKWKGRHYYLGKAGSQEAKKAYAELLAKLAEEPDSDSEEPPARAGLTVAELAELWLAHAAERYGDGAKEARQHVYSVAPLVVACGNCLVAEFGPPQLEQARDEMIRRGWSRGVINHRIRRIRTAWRWAERRGHAPPGSWAALRVVEAIPPGDRRVRTLPPRQPCSWADLAKVCRYCRPAVRDMLLIQWFTGMRAGEARTMRAGEVDTESWVYRPTDHKNAWRGHERAVEIGPRARKILERRLAGLAPGDYVFPATDGGCYTVAGYSGAVGHACRKAGVKLTPYQCRYAFCERVAREMGAEAARVGMGHKTPHMTARYAGRGTTLAADVARRLG